VRPASDGELTVEVVVADTGIGIEPSRIDDLFEPFSQGDSSTTRRFGGTGLGLAISRQLVELMRGELSATSVPGEGTTFTFTAIVEPSRAERHTRRRRSSLPEGLRILIVDDSTANREILRASLESRVTRCDEAESGEDALVSCPRCGYAANVEQAAIPEVPPPVHAGTLKTMQKVATPDQRTIEEVSAFLGMPPDRFIKTLLVTTDGGETVAALVRGDHTVSEAKLIRALGATVMTMADAATVERITGAAVGFAGPVGLKVRVLADQALRGIAGAVVGANETDQHLVDVAQERDLPGLAFADLRFAEPGDPCPRCPDGVYEGHRGIEVGQVFYLGTKYSKAMGATYLDANGNEQVMEMGCYGIGVTRTAAAAIEQNHDDNGIIWPLAIAPAQVHLIAVNPKEAAQQQAADKLYADLQAAGVEVLYDDREERPGVKFKDADLIGIPYRVTVGPKALARDAVEFKPRRAAQAEDMALADAVGKLTTLAREGGTG